MLEIIINLNNKTKEHLLFLTKHLNTNNAEVIKLALQFLFNKIYAEDVAIRNQPEQEINIPSIKAPWKENSTSVITLPAKYKSEGDFDVSIDGDIFGK